MIMNLNPNVEDYVFQFLYPNGGDSTIKNIFDCYVTKTRLLISLLGKVFSKFYHIHSEMVVKYNVGLKTLLQHGISEPVFLVI